MSALRLRIREIAQALPRFGYVRIWVMLRREGWAGQQEARPFGYTASRVSRVIETGDLMLFPKGY